MLNTTRVAFGKDQGSFAKALTAVALLCLVSATTASAARIDIIDGEGFESPRYSTTFAPPGLAVGSLEGQSASLPGDSTTQKWLASTGTQSSAVVQTAVVNSGSQAVQVSRTAGDAPSFWGAPVSAWPDNANFVCIEWDMMVRGPAGGFNDFGPFFGIDAIDDVTVGGSDFGLLGSMGVLATTGTVVYTDDAQTLKETGRQVNFGEWNHFHMDLDFANHQYSLYLNDPTLSSPLGPYPFVGGVALGDGGNLNNFSDAPIGTFAFNGDTSATAFFDNYEVYQVTSKVPEPTTLVLGLAALVSTTGCLRRRNCVVS